MATYYFPKVLCSIVIIFCPTTIANDRFITLNCSNQFTGIHHHRTVLFCEYKSQWEKNCNISWIWKDRNSQWTETPCTSDNEKTAQKQKRCLTDYKKVSLIIEKTESLDAGNYQIFIDCGPGGHVQKSVQLSIKAPYAVLQVSKRIEGGDKGLSCSTLGHAPAELHWKNETGTILPANSNITETEDKLFNTTIFISVFGELCSINYSCSLCYEHSCISARLECPNSTIASQSREEKIRTAFGIHLSLGLIVILFILLAFMGLFTVESKFFKH
ncbi:uncharacterized protein LOC109921572 isoform X2 [Rhincodon typus]|uniref:uncharacterized protein LOC109921572 isoform X2 n=1 Tax=Rhincodon typus TaxID=259920 RepID=UPI00202FD4A2|nr:uncharacterized protein LOC109921572 isoform X2 [Rhincodon typus]XP_048466605.1 uncharacterized protein LOC109921572 isoform X2 [Rhincodon typus]XP_048466606.1 uncharacterized protein LOC109921572 isoform X2 [Rhincodon typus]